MTVQTGSAHRPAAPVPGADRAGPHEDCPAPRRALRPGRPVRRGPLRSLARVGLLRVAATLRRP
ncbi:hypothetical protein [Streptomyces sp. NPDC051183]|uniref:hypothetical protein n=1 Tax=Streptomyces sp. NPDC051183 TaxID=3155165 RepID=UPI0034336822